MEELQGSPFHLPPGWVSSLLPRGSLKVVLGDVLWLEALCSALSRRSVPVPGAMAAQRRVCV